MAALVLISTLSFSIEKHYCGDNLVDVSLFADAQKCGLESPEDDLVQMDQSCCKDVMHLVEGQDELNLAQTDVLNTSQTVFILAFAYVYGGLYDLESQNETPAKHYTPPKVVQDIQVLHEVFLI